MTMLIITVLIDCTDMKSQIQRGHQGLCHRSALSLCAAQTDSYKSPLQRVQFRVPLLGVLCFPGVCSSR